MIQMSANAWDKMAKKIDGVYSKDTLFHVQLEFNLSQKVEDNTEVLKMILQVLKKTTT